MDSITGSQLPTYEQFYGFAQSPFSLTPDPRFLFRSESHAYAITSLLQTLERREGFVVLTGEVGTGKTTVCQAVLEQLGPTTFTSLILNPLVSIDELLRDVLVDFGVASKEAVRGGRFAAFTTHQLIATLGEFLRSLEPLGASALIVVDEAQHLSPKVLEQLRIIAGLETAQARLLQVLLVGQLNLLDVLGEDEMRQVNQRILLRATLQPLDREALEAYVNWRLSVARSATSVAFETEALDLVQTVSGGVPRMINLLCDRALAAGATEGVSDITPAHVKVAATDLGFPTPAESRWSRRTTVTAVGIMAALLVAGAAVLAAVPADSLVELARPAAPVAPRPALATPISAIAPPTEDLLLPPPILPPPVPRRVPPPIAPISTDPLPSVR